MMLNQQYEQFDPSLCDNQLLKILFLVPYMWKFSSAHFRVNKGAVIIYDRGWGWREMFLNIKKM